MLFFYEKLYYSYLKSRNRVFHIGGGEIGTNPSDSLSVKLLG
jgi:hypothetical protein